MTPTETRAGGARVVTRIDGAVILDLIQFESLSRARGAIRVTNGTDKAMLYFRDGRLVHAIAGRLCGGIAVREVLSWGEGVLEPCDAPWPGFETINALSETALLRPARGSEDQLTPEVLTLPLGEPSDSGLDLRVSPHGEVITQQRAGSDEFADAVAYAVQLVDLAGELLALGRFTEVDLTFEKGRALIRREPDGGVVAFRPERTSTRDPLHEPVSTRGV